MDKLVLKGPNQLTGSVKISSSKNSSLPIIAASLLAEGEVVLKDLPRLVDVKTMIKLLFNLGAVINEDDGYTLINPTNLSHFKAQYDFVKTMRASILVLGPLLAKYGKTTVSLPGGCAIGARPIDIHLDALTKMGATIELHAGYVCAKCSGPLRGAKISFSFPSVGATENIMMAAALARGTTVIKNAACEPEIVDLANFLNAMGGKVEGAGSSEIVIEGVTSLGESGISYRVIPDRIEAATYIIAGILTNSNIRVENVGVDALDSLFAVLEEMGANFSLGPDYVDIKKRNSLKGINVETAPFPGLPTDIQAQLMVLTTLADSPSTVTEHIFENRFMHVPELNRMGANILLKGHSAFIAGKAKLMGAEVMCTDLRASAALLLAALAAEGTSEIHRIYHLDRGYDRFDQKLKKLGVNICRTSE